MRTNLLCCLLAVVCIGLWAARQPRPTTGDLRLKLILSKRPINPLFVEGDCFSLTLGKGQVNSSRRRNGLLLPGPERTLEPAQIAQLTQQLRQAGAWELSDADSKLSGDLYTYLEVQEGDQPPHSSNWRGLTAEQKRCADVLLQAPFGSDIHGALQFTMTIPESPAPPKLPLHR